MVRVSIIIPHFAHGCFLKQAVASALGQTFQDLEVIVVDDCDEHASASEILAAITDSRLRIIRHSKNLGASAARNTGISNAHGEFILPLDSDDFLDISFLEKTLPLLSDSNLGGVYTAVQLFGLKEEVISREWTILGILKGELSAQVCLLFRRQLHDELGGYDVSLAFGEDSDFILRAIKAGWRFKHFEEPLYFYRQHVQSACHRAPSQLSAEQASQWVVKAVEMHADVYNEHMSEIVACKEMRYWLLLSEYAHLHTEFHKLLELYTNLENSVRQASARPSIWHRIRSRSKNFMRGIRIQNKTHRLK